jgi:DNA-directed RNA polymerase subunit RPC12/RpoP
MNERARRPILHLKLGGTPSADTHEPPRPKTPSDAPTTVPATYTWKCRPCGTAFVPPRDGPADEAVRCPACNARLGRAGDFRSEPPLLEKLRARAVKVAPPPTPMTVRTVRTPPVTVRILKKVR